VPWIAAITGLEAPSIVSCTSNREAPRGALPNSLMSAPAMKVRPSQISTIALAAESATARSIPAFSPSRTSADSAFTGGEFSVRTATSPSMLRSVTVLIAAMRAPPV
jgi:hypothetical protein